MEFARLSCGALGCRIHFGRTFFLLCDCTAFRVREIRIGKSMSWLVARTSSSLDCWGAVDLNPRVYVIKVNGSLPLHPVLPDNCKKAAASRLAVKKTRHEGGLCSLIRGFRRPLPREQHRPWPMPASRPFAQQPRLRGLGAQVRLRRAAAPSRTAPADHRHDKDRAPPQRSK